MRADLSLSDALLVVTLGYLVQSALSTAMLAANPEFGDVVRLGLGARLIDVVIQVATFFLLAHGAYAVGRRFGGKGSLESVRAVVAWHFLATGFLAPLHILGMSGLTPEGGPGGAFPLVMAAVAVSLWMFASFVAEAHGFEKIGGVIAVSVLGFMFVGMVGMVLLAILSGQA